MVPYEISALETGNSVAFESLTRCAACGGHLELLALYDVGPTTGVSVAKTTTGISVAFESFEEVCYSCRGPG